ncbi:hypothetical protein PNEG_04259 [Pneumocystis murina B123]|uniref:Uncharacterized protein n=1 Tax=Pneumocystis murina (strain B123) TaxID=1069680 RepID=A0A0W4ZX39_PNEMU|nr:hypothetical protein PNEG_04259 [Pneumocystis murina B123]KTW32937.1 hypothetical protein PNEG_04259 [Pneumocystis murina B123]
MFFYQFISVEILIELFKLLNFYNINQIYHLNLWNINQSLKLLKSESIVFDMDFALIEHEIEDDLYLIEKLTEIVDGYKDGNIEIDSLYGKY